MNRKVYIILIGLPFPAGALAQPYVGLGGGITFVSDADAVVSDGTSFTATFDTGFVIGVAAGQDFGILRAEAQAHYLQADVDQFKAAGLGADVVGDISTILVMANVWLDFKNRSPVTPYLGGGIGASFISVSETTSSGIVIFTEADDQVLALQVGAGLVFSLSQHVLLDLGYRFVSSNDPKFESVEAEFTSQHILLGGRYRF